MTANFIPNYALYYKLYKNTLFGNVFAKVCGQKLPAFGRKLTKTNNYAACSAQYFLIRSITATVSS